MAWRLANSIKTLLAQVNEVAPHRRKDSDGGIGNAEHAARNSDHNPYIVVRGEGIVRAFDFTHAPETGFDAYALAAMLVKNKDSRIRYIISNGNICSGKGGPQPWAWRKYTGPNKHDHHTHVSVTENELEFDNPGKWSFDGFGDLVAAYAPSANSFVVPPPTLRLKSRGDIVKKMQVGIGLKGANADGYFGQNTEAALMAYQKSKGLVADGICGPGTWRAIGAA